MRKACLYLLSLGHSQDLVLPVLVQTELSETARENQPGALGIPRLSAPTSPVVINKAKAISFTFSLLSLGKSFRPEGPGHLG